MLFLWLGLNVASGYCKTYFYVFETMFKTIDSDNYADILNSFGISPEEIDREKSTCADGLYGKICPLLGLINNYQSRLHLKNYWITNKNKLLENMDVTFDERTGVQIDLKGNIMDNSDLTNPEFAECSGVDLETEKSIILNEPMAGNDDSTQNHSVPTVSCRKNKVFSNCRKFLAKTILPEDTFRRIWNSKLHRAHRREIFLAATHNIIPCICNVKHFSTIPRKVSCYMYCIHGVCRKYIAELTPDRVINVWMNDVEINHVEVKEKRRRAPSKRENMKYKMSLLKENAGDQSFSMDFGEEDFDSVPVEDCTSANDYSIATTNEDFANTTNGDTVNSSYEEFSVIPSDDFTNVPMLDIIRKISSSVTKRPCWNEIHKFIMDVYDKQTRDRERGEEATIHGFETFFLSTANQLKIASSAKSELIIPILHFDFTGSQLQRLGFNFDGKYYCSAMMRWGSQILPIFDIVSIKQSEINLRRGLYDVHCFTLEHTGKWNIFPTIVVNFCKPSIDAVLAVTMSTTLNKYLEQLFGYLCSKNVNKPEVILLLCSSQYVKLLIWDVKETVKNRKLQHSYICALLKIMNSTTFEEADSKVVSLLNVLLLQHATVEINQHQQIFADDSASDVDDISSQVINGDEIIKGDDMIHKEGPFYKRYSAVMQNILNSKVKSEGPANSYYNRTLAVKILNKHLPFLPLWSSFLSPNRERVSNSIIENYFRHIREQCLSSGVTVENLKIGEFMDMHSAKTKTVCGKIMSDKQDWNNISNVINYDFRTTNSNISNV